MGQSQSGHVGDGGNKNRATQNNRLLPQPTNEIRTGKYQGTITGRATPGDNIKNFMNNSRDSGS